ncbi:MAG TPA: hypothetical protein VG754_12240 [Verrucomicrobiae bacterium]|jgi:type II secretory pathway component PulC|nr:hypothetical protein [Verrucomicrobiae bacterium]
MLIRIALIVAILGGIAVGVVNFVWVKDKITTTINQRDEYHKTADTETAAHRKFEKLAKDTQTKLDATNAALVSMTDERDKLQADNSDLTKKNLALTDTLEKTTKERNTAQDELAAWRELGIPLTNIKATLASLKTVTEERDAIAEEKKILQKKVTALSTEVDFLTGREPEVKLPAGLRGKVLVADPRYEFVVLDIGEKQGVLENGRLLINRNGKLVAKVQVKSVQADRSIANVMPGWKLGEIMEGDQVLY